MRIVPDLDLCAMALLRLGTRSTIMSLDEGSAEARACKSFYGPCLRSLLGTPQAQGGSLHNWNWCRADQMLEPARSTIPGWRWQAALPDDCVKPVALLEKTPCPRRTGKFFQPHPNFATGLSAGQQVIRFNAPHPVLSYISDSVPVAQWPASFTEAFTAHLALRLAIDLTGNGDLVAQMRMDAETLTDYAVQSDQSSEIRSTSYMPDWIAGREGWDDDYVALWGLRRTHDPVPTLRPAGLEIVPTYPPAFQGISIGRENTVIDLPPQRNQMPALWKNPSHDWLIGHFALEKTPLGYQRHNHSVVMEPSIPFQSDTPTGRWQNPAHDWRVGNMALEETPLGSQRHNHSHQIEPDTHD